MIAIIDLHPRRSTISSATHMAATPAMPIEIDEMTVNTSGGLYEELNSDMVSVLLKVNV